MKNFEYQSYRHKTQRPQAEASIDKTESLFTVSFSWGEINATEQANDAFINSYFASKNDLEVTSPFRTIPSLTPLANRIRAALLIANGAVYSNFNTKAFAAGCEFLCLTKEDREAVIGQVSGPSVILVRNRENFLLSTTSDHCFSKTAPLPVNLLGTDSECYPHLFSFRFEDGDQVFLISCSYLPNCVLSLNLSSPMGQLTQFISQENPAIPFWIGRINL